MVKENSQVEGVKKILTQSLLAFVLISIGFALGKHSVSPVGQAEVKPLDDGTGHQIVVYYLHSTFRCVTCKSIQTMTRQLLDSAYGNELASGKIRWIEDNFQENEALAKQFEVVASCVVVAEIKQGEVIAYKRMDDVWTLMSDPTAFNGYISDAIEEYLKKLGGKS